MCAAVFASSSAHHVFLSEIGPAHRPSKDPPLQLWEDGLLDPPTIIRPAAFSSSEAQFCLRLSIFPQHILPFSLVTHTARPAKPSSLRGEGRRSNHAGHLAPNFSQWRGSPLHYSCHPLLCVSMCCQCTKNNVENGWKQHFVSLIMFFCPSTRVCINTIDFTLLTLMHS